MKSNQNILPIISAFFSITAANSTIGLHTHFRIESFRNVSLYRNFSASNYSSEIDQGFKKLKLLLLKQRALVVLDSLRDVAPFLQSLQAYIDQLLNSNETILDSMGENTITAIISELNTLEGHLIHNRNLANAHSSIYKKSLSHLQAEMRKFLETNRTSGGSLEVTTFTTTSTVKALSELEKISESISGWSWAVEIRNAAEVNLTSGNPILKGVSMHGKHDPAFIASNSSKILAFSVNSIYDPRVLFLYKLESAPISFIMGIKWPGNFRFGMNFVSQNSTDLNVFKFSDLKICNKPRGTLIIAKEGYQARANIKDENYKLVVSISVENVDNRI